MRAAGAWRRHGLAVWAVVVLVAGIITAGSGAAADADDDLAGGGAAETAGDVATVPGGGPAPTEDAGAPATESASSETATTAAAATTTTDNPSATDVPPDTRPRDETTGEPVGPLPPGGVLSGTVADPAGNPIPGICVDTPSPLPHEVHAVTDDEGRWSVTMPPGFSQPVFTLEITDCDGTEPDWSAAAHHHLLVVTGRTTTVDSILTPAG
jgi:hypothetical protein